MPRLELLSLTLGPSHANLNLHSLSSAILLSNIFWQLVCLMLCMHSKVFQPQQSNSTGSLRGVSQRLWLSPREANQSAIPRLPGVQRWNLSSILFETPRQEKKTSWPRIIEKARESLAISSAKSQCGCGSSRKRNILVTIKAGPRLACGEVDAPKRNQTYKPYPVSDVVPSLHCNWMFVPAYPGHRNISLPITFHKSSHCDSDREIASFMSACSTCHVYRDDNLCWSVLTWCLAVIFHITRLSPNNIQVPSTFPTELTI